MKPRLSTYFKKENTPVTSKPLETFTLEFVIAPTIGHNSLVMTDYVRSLYADKGCTETERTETLILLLFNGGIKLKNDYARVDCPYCTDGNPTYTDESNDCLFCTYLEDNAYG